MEGQGLDPIDYAVFGVLCAAKFETGPEGARRVFRIWLRLDKWSNEEIHQSVCRLIDLGWVRQKEIDRLPGFIYAEALVSAACTIRSSTASQYGGR